MNIRFLKLAQKELDDAVNYYNRESAGLGYEFLSEVFTTIDRIIEYPNAWQKFLKETRRCLLRRFPYGIVYIVEDDTLVIFAVAHTHRNPDYWIDRK
jgi:plasmid stabilization system protein ParE